MKTKNLTLHEARIAFMAGYRIEDCDFPYSPNKVYDLVIGAPIVKYISVSPDEAKNNKIEFSHMIDDVSETNCGEECECPGVVSKLMIPGFPDNIGTHPHKEVIIDFINGATIETKVGSNWVACPQPHFHTQSEYRAKEQKFFIGDVCELTAGTGVYKCILTHIELCRVAFIVIEGSQAGNRFSTSVDAAILKGGEISKENVLAAATEGVIVVNTSR